MHYKHTTLYHHYYAYNRAQLSRIKITNHAHVAVRGIEFDVYSLTLEQLADILSIYPSYEPAFIDWHTNYQSGDKVNQDFINFYLKNNKIQISHPLHKL